MSAFDNRSISTGHDEVRHDPPDPEAALATTDAATMVSEQLPPEFINLSERQIYQRYQHCARNLSPAMLDLIKSDAALGGEFASPDLVRARILYQVWRAKRRPLFRSCRSAETTVC